MASEYLHDYLGRGPVITSWAIGRPPSDEEIRFHAQLNDRLLALVHERNSLWGKLRGWLFGERLDQ
jgi:hypothetical protein